MQKITNKRTILFYGCSGIGLNLLNLIVGSYLCSALFTKGFASTDILNQTYLQRDLVIIALWGIFTLIAKIFDGIIDIPMASFIDSFRSRFGRRRTLLAGGTLLTLASFLMFLVIPCHEGGQIWNTIYYGVVLCLFYMFYTLTMTTYYATFSEITSDSRGRSRLSNIKSICDVLYFIIGFVLIRLFLNSYNIRVIALCCAPLAFLMFIPVLIIKEKEGKNGSNQPKVKHMWRGLKDVFSHKSFMSWMCVYAILTMSVQLFIAGINEYFSSTNMNMPLIVGCALIPIPFTMLLHNLIYKKFGFKLSYIYLVGIFALAMISLFGVSFCQDTVIKNAFGACFGLFASCAIGPFFSLSYYVPSSCSCEIHSNNPAMFFAIQGLFCGAATGVAAGPILIALRSTGHVQWLTCVSCGLSLLSLVAAIFLLKPKAKDGK